MSAKKYTKEKRNKDSLMSRREVMALTAGAVPFLMSPTRMLLKGLVDGLIEKARASESGVTLRNLVNVHLSGAPPRWYWDGFFSPYANTAPATSTGLNGFYINRFQASTNGYRKAEYGTTPFMAQCPDPTTGKMTSRQVYLPQLWSASIPTTSGVWVPMTRLLDNWVTMRGIYSPIPFGHDAGRNAQTRPNTSAPSLLGAVADASPLPAAAVAYSSGGFFSQAVAYRGNSSSQLISYETYPLPSSANPIKDVLTLFDDSGDSAQSVDSLTSSSAIDGLVQTALNDISAFADSEAPGSATMQKMQGEAKALLQAGIGNAVAAFPKLYAKYLGLIQSVNTGMFGSNPSYGIPQMTDQSIPLPPNIKDSSGNTWGAIENFLCSFNSGDPVCNNSDLRTLIGRNAVGNLTQPRALAAGFALAEFLVCNGYSAAIALNSYQVVGLVPENPTAWSAGNPKYTNSLNNMQWNMDEHRSGTHTSLVVNAFIYSCLSACLYELVNQLKSNGNLFNNTVIMLTGDFNRQPNDQGTDVTAIPGAGHSADSMVITAISGALSGFTVIGDVYVGKSGSGYRANAGNWGASAPMAVNGATRNLTLHDSSSTIAWLCGTPAPFSNVPSLLTTASNGTIVPAVDIAGEVPN